MMTRSFFLHPLHIMCVQEFIYAPIMAINPTILHLISIYEDPPETNYSHLKPFHHLHTPHHYEESSPPTRYGQPGPDFILNVTAIRIMCCLGDYYLIRNSFDDIFTIFLFENSSFLDLHSLWAA